MNDYKQRFIIALVSIVAFFVLVGIGGSIDYTDHVILRMSYDEYDTIKQRLMDENDGKVPTDSEIVRWWERHHE